MLLDSRREAPTDAPSRLAALARRRLARLRFRGRAVECPCCGRGLRAFAADWNRPDAICPGCGSHERHRALWLYLVQRTEVTAVRLREDGGGLRLLHFAPEHCLRENLGGLRGLEYVTADLDRRVAELQVDITAMPFEDHSFDAIVCSHVLEHVEADRQAMGELARVLRPGGWALVMVPLDLGREVTLEDPTVKTPEQRVRAYWQEDHVRLYAMDIAQRLAESGFVVQSERFVEGLPAGSAERFGLVPEEVVFRCTPAEPAAHPSS